MNRERRNFLAGILWGDGGLPPEQRKCHSPDDNASGRPCFHLMGIAMEIIVLRFVHILGGIMWVGAAVFNALFLAPTLRRVGPSAGPVMAALRERGLFVFLPSMAVLTILSGTRLMAIVSAGFDASWFNSVPGATYAWSGVAAIVAFVLGIAIARPLGAKLGELGAELAHASDDATRAALGQRLATAHERMALVGTVVTVLLVGSAAGMAVARYLS
jgi:hypothetical protein